MAVSAERSVLWRPVNPTGRIGVIATVVGNTQELPLPSWSNLTAMLIVSKGEITKFDSTPGKTRRGFFGRCGSTLTCESLPGPMVTHFHIGAFDEASRFRPTGSFFGEERLPWLNIMDE